MQTIRNERIIPCDVDDTLIIHNPKGMNIARASVLDPESGRFLSMGVNEPMVKLVKEEKHRGAYVIVWSRGGYQWALNVVAALELQDYVDLILTKPMVYFDDTPVDKWLETRIYLDPETVYKR